MQHEIYDKMGDDETRLQRYNYEQTRRARILGQKTIAE
jgi:hypothetical protein